MRIAAREGLAGLTIGRLARDLAMSKSGLFAHFRSKRALELPLTRPETCFLAKFSYPPPLPMRASIAYGLCATLG